MLLWDWNTLHFTGLGFQIAAGVIALGLSLSWIRVRNGHLETNPERLRAVQLVGRIALGFFTAGAILILWYETHLL